MGPSCIERTEEGEKGLEWFRLLPRGRNQGLSSPAFEDLLLKSLKVLDGLAISPFPTLLKSH